MQTRDFPIAPAVQGWAVIKDGKINIRTISDTRRAALVNWLVVEAKVLIMASYTDDDIERMWHEKADGRTICTTVSIEQDLSNHS